jgi:hypothetical protein
MLCARPRSDGTFSTTVKLREACKGNEVEIGIVTLQPLRLFGPDDHEQHFLTTTTTSTSTTLYCGLGTAVNGVCWYTTGRSRRQLRFNLHQHSCPSYDEATRTFAGSDGSLENCVAVAQALGVTPTSSQDSDCGKRGGLRSDPSIVVIRNSCAAPRRLTTSSASSTPAVRIVRIARDDVNAPGRVAARLA